MSQDNKYLQLTQSLKSERDYLLSKDYIERQKSKELANILDSELIKVIIGPRRSGKSTIALQAMRKYQDFFYINFDNLELLMLDDVFSYIESEQKNFACGRNILLDEVQNIDKFELLVTRLQRNGYNVVITGSNANLLSSELATNLTGRYAQVEVLPFDYQEARRLVPDLSYIEYLRLGGFPEQLSNRGRIVDYLNTLFESVVLKDIIRRYNLRNIRDLTKISDYLMRTPAQSSSYNKLADKLDLASVNTLIDYYGYLEEAYLISKLHYLSYKSSEVIKSSFKTFLVDTGVFLNNPDLFQRNMGYLFENSIFVDLLRAGCKPNINLFQFRTSSGKEVDFLIKKGDENILLQTSLSLRDNETREREFKSLLDAKYENSRKYVVVMEEGEEDLGEQGIEVVHAADLKV